jgi:hypothetical protein
MKQNIINHFTWILDASTSMKGHIPAVIKLADSQISGLAERSKFHQQETRITIYSFSDPIYHDRLKAKCLVWDMDVLRAPSIAGLYKVDGNTALCSAVTEVIFDLKDIPEKHGDHSHLIHLVTDGMENCSPAETIKNLPDIIGRLPGNWTLAAFVPGHMSKHYLTQYGFPAGNIEVWDPNSKEGLEEVSVAAAAASNTYMTSRSSGVRSTTSLYSMKAPSVNAIKGVLTPKTPGSYYFENVNPEDLAVIERGRIDQFMKNKLGHAYIPERTYYEMTKRERIQYYKQLAIAVYDKDRNTEDIYVGTGIRKLLDLPEESEKKEVRVSPGKWNEKGYKVFVQTTSDNRRLVPGTRVLVMR